ncbi:hypothetical protein RGQ29_031535 [Quercus rubra]|uniref:Uncharacterized protein n=1 Tax=Quercus rubra TaxID=3512 RepID=A0AAN7EKX1_QUERU|nr:hypothetical protein RGQ29_031535 [Quercus rubra]
MAGKIGSIMVGVLLLLSFWLLLFLLSVTSSNPGNLESSLNEHQGRHSEGQEAPTYFNALFGIVAGCYSTLAYSMMCMMVDNALASHNLDQA